MKRKLTCIVCPKGCTLSIDEQTLDVNGAGCTKGVLYAREELTNPIRTVTTTVRIEQAPLRVLPVKTCRAVPKSQMRDIVAALSKVRVKAPIEQGEVVLRDAAGTGVDVVATRAMTKIQ